MRIVLLILFLSTAAFAQTPCGDLAALPGKVVKTPASGRDPGAVANVNKIMAMVEKSVAGFTGGVVKIGLFDAGTVNITTSRPSFYTVQMHFLKYECVGGRVKPEAATDSWFYVAVNQLPFFTANNSAELLKLPNGQSMFYSKLRFDGEFKGFPRIKPLYESNDAAVFLSPRNRLPLRTITQGEVIFQYRPWILARLDEPIKRVEKYTDPQSQQTLAKLKKERAACVERLDAFSKSGAVSNTAFVEFIDFYCEPAKMFIKPTNPRAKAITVFDDGFFNKNLPPSTPQFGVVYWREVKDTKRDSLKRAFLERFLNNFDFAAFGGMIK